MTGQTISIPQAAGLMGLSRTQAWRRLVRLNRKYPQLRILQRAAYDGTAGKHMVSVASLRRILLDEDALTLADVSGRVGFVESDIRSLQSRVGRLENERFQQRKTGLVLSAHR